MYQTQLNCFAQSGNAIPLQLILEKNYSGWLEEQTNTTQNWLIANGHQGKAGEMALLANAQGELQQAILVLKNEVDWWAVGEMPLKLPENTYTLAPQFENANLSKFVLMWALGAYQFTRYKKAKRRNALLSWPATVDKKEILDLASAIYLTRDLINTPSYDMMPAQLSEAAKAIADQGGGQYHEVVDEITLRKEYPCVHHVGRGSVYASRVIDLRWGNPAHPKVTLLGKGVCFDTGGVDIKSADGMSTMKKDMGGAAHVLALAQLIMAQKLPIYLRVLVSAVDNAVSGSSFRPGDVLTSRAGITIEVGNTDAEGRLVLCDIIADAVAEQPELLIDFATLTGAARIAVGTEIAAFFTNNNQLASDLIRISMAEQDPCWQLPLYEPYHSLIESSIADINNCAESSYGGAITAALFLKDFIPVNQSWIHFDIMAANKRTKPARPEGGEAMGLRAVYELLKGKYK